tara:strand:- start:303 stop:716 length:414 start_codon:yes stop_codon:yes gene_type:complete
MAKASVAVEVKIMEILDTAGRTERLIPGIKKPHASRMYDLLEMSYSKQDLGFYNKKPLRLYPNAKQIASWELAIELMLLVNLEQRRLLWGRACRFSWVQLAKRFGVHRTTIKKRYLETIFLISRLADKSLIDKIVKI